ncbi:MAG: hypothetical protein ACYTFI_18395 [Planctomycetota bacterium]|jgi:hypothetical protein
MSGKLVAASIAALIAAAGCTTARTEQRAGKKGPGPERIEELAATSPPVQSASPGAQKPVAGKKEAQPETPGTAAIDRAAKAGKYLFVFFRRDDGERTRKMRGVFDAALKKLADRAESVAIDVADSSEKGIVKRFGVDRAPMPLVLVLAPNGAVTGGFPVRFEEKQLTEAFVGPSTAKVLKGLQDGKIVLVCLQNAQTKSNALAMRGVKDFAADAEYAKTTEVVTLDPADAAEAKFLGQIRVDPKASEATTVLLAPPGTIVGKFKGATDKGKLVAALKACGAGCGPSSGSKRRA